MKKLSLVGKINIGLGIILFLLGIFLFITELSEGFSLKDFPQSIAFILIGISIFLSASFYKKDVN
ncbi:hypothetical protein [Sporosarcina jiandibaonis]|uniref:hypothetical protein n=1 Tax=Sporosarcina jiandibaonis TaxID=2715535 RepID=UPI0015546D23|nr:hypothetical protein [Sporosarcina jiandibaonis]